MGPWLAAASTLPRDGKTDRELGVRLNPLLLLLSLL
jgi:hypothetical protein